MKITCLTKQNLLKIENFIVLCLAQKWPKLFEIFMAFELHPFLQ